MKGSFYVFERKNPIFDLRFPSSVILCIMSVDSMGLKKTYSEFPFWQENPSKLLVKSEKSIKSKFLFDQEDTNECLVHFLKM